MDRFSDLQLLLELVPSSQQALSRLTATVTVEDSWN